ncbi:MAG: PilX N-terminal domain-containing pilus assembly protein [Syntrophales bacterium LBB04]|nr:PilX N-terminal domain-containing pilus assembly protein [Syntrophales bacterium LBB04]
MHSTVGKTQNGAGKLGDERGIVLVVVLLIIAILSLLGLAANRNAVTDTAISANHVASLRAFHAAEAGAEYGFNRLRYLLPSTPSISAPAIAGFTFDNFSVAPQPPSTTAVLTGTWAGLTAILTTYQITSKAREDTSNAAATVAVQVQDQLIPVFQFGIFYQNDLEMLPGANMTFTGGRIHTNSNLYMNPDGSATLSIDSKITSAHNIYHQREDRVATQNPVQIKDAGGTYRSMTIDSNTTNWASLSQSTWGGTVKSIDNGVTGLNLPEPTGTLDILGQGDGSMYQKSGLRIINGVAKNKNGAVVDITYQDSHHNTINPISTSTFYDQREQRNVTVTEVDVAKLQASPNAMAALNSPPSGQDAHVMYVSTDNQSVRLINGSTLPDGGLTIATNRPLYIKGDYNTANKPAAVFGDATTILSNNWNDSNSALTLSSRIASNTTVNAAVMTGNKNTAGSQYSGGVENLMRFLEDWSSKTLTYAGSLVCLWQSQYATGNWPGTGTVYNPPTRNWSYGIDMNHLPPGTPCVRNINRLMWRHVTS